MQVFCLWPDLLRGLAHALRGNVRLSPWQAQRARLLFQAFSASKPDVESASSYQ